MNQDSKRHPVLLRRKAVMLNKWAKRPGCPRTRAIVVGSDTEVFAHRGMPEVHPEAFLEGLKETKYIMAIDN